MKKFFLLLSAVILLIAVPVQKARAQASVTAHATAEVIEALTANETAALNFGRFSPETNGGEIRLTPEGVRVSTGTITLNTGSYNQAKFYLTGHYEATVTIALPTTSTILTNSENGKTMEVTGWESNPTAGLGTGVLNNGLLTVDVGATLKVGNLNENPVGMYTGTYAITFSYN